MPDVLQRTSCLEWANFIRSHPSVAFLLRNVCLQKSWCKLTTSLPQSFERSNISKIGCDQSKLEAPTVILLKGIKIWSSISWIFVHLIFLFLLLTYDDFKSNPHNWIPKSSKIQRLYPGSLTLAPKIYWTTANVTASSIKMLLETLFKWLYLKQCRTNNKHCAACLNVH